MIYVSIDACVKVSLSSCNNQKLQYLEEKSMLIFIINFGSSKSGTKHALVLLSIIVFSFRARMNSNLKLSFVSACLFQF